MAAITYRGTTILNEAVNGAGWKFTPGSKVAQPVEVESPLGVGYWIKPANIAKATHTLEAHWRSATPMSIKAAMEALAVVAEKGPLVVPVYGTFNNCLLSGLSDWDMFQSDGGVYIASMTLTFTEYP